MQRLVSSKGVSSRAGPKHPLRTSAPGTLSSSRHSVQSQSGSASSAPTQQPQFPPYKVIKKGDGYDLRLYDLYPIVEMEYQRREEGYLNLGEYFHGGNEKRTWYKMTAPVVMRYYPKGRKVMQMFVGSPRGAASQPGDAPSKVTTLPAPSNPDVRLDVAGGEVVAVRYFDGYITPQTAEANRRQLIKDLARDGLQLADPEQEGFFRVGQYGEVYTLATRVNELLLQVKF